MDVSNLPPPTLCTFWRRWHRSLALTQPAPGSAGALEPVFSVYVQVFHLLHQASEPLGGDLV